MAVQMLGIKTKFTDDQGRPLVGGKVHAYFAGTTTYQDTFKDPDMTIVNTNPIILDDSGSADVYLNGSYRIRIFDKNDVLIEEQDGVTQSVNGEITTAKGEIIGLYGAVLNSLTNEVKRAVAAEKTIADSLTSETTRAKSAESALQSSIDAEATRAKKAESDLNTNITKEVNDRKLEVTRLDEVDAVLQAQINSVGGGKLAYKTYAAMVADKANITANSSIDIIADTDDKNGTYLYDGTNFVKSKYDLEKLIRAKVQNTFGTYAQMIASNLADGSYALVADDTDDKNGIYIKKGGAWVKSGYDPIGQAKVYSDEIIKQNLSRFFEPSKNMYNHATTQVGQAISSSGDLLPQANGGVSDFIGVKPNSTYHFKVNYYWNFSYVAFYDKSKKFISRISTSLASGETNGAFTTPSNASYIRISLNLVHFLLGNTMLSETPIDVVTPYSLPVLKNAIASSEFKADIINDAHNLINIATMDSSSFINNYIEKSDNLFNYQDTERAKVISSSGEVVTHNILSFVSNYINVIAGESYTASGDFAATKNLFSYVAYYNADKVFVSRSNMNGGTPTVLVIPMGVAYIRIMSNLEPEKYSRMLNKGATALPYKPYGMVLKNIPTSLDFKKSLRQKYYYDTNLNLTYSTTRDFTKYKTIPTGTSEAVYSAFDALMAASDGYITKQRLRDSVQGREISAYFLKPPVVRDNLHLIKQVDKRPTVFVLCSIHGHEHLPAFAGYALAAELCNNYRSDDVLSALRYNANIIIIPVGNPDGWGVNSRKNANGIDIARNFPTSTWILRESSSEEYGGVAPASEPETLNIMQVITENSIDIFYDFHNYKISLAQIQTGSFFWILPPFANDKKTTQLARTLSTRMTRKLQKEFAVIPDNWESGYSEMSSHAMPMFYAHENGVPISCTFELSRNLPDFKGDGTNSEEYATDHARITFEFFVNWLLICLDGVKES